MPPVPLGRILTLFKEVYKSIDIRVACLRENDLDWRNVLTVIRFSNHELDTLHSTQARLVERLGRIDDERFKTILAARPFSQWQTLNRQIMEGKIEIDDQAILCESGQDLESLSGSVQPFPHYAFNETEGNFLEVYSARNKTSEQVLRGCDSSAVRAGFPTIYEAINSLLMMRRFSSGVTTDIIVLAPTLATLEARDFDPNTGEMTVVSCIPAGLLGCLLNILVKGDGRQEPRPIKSKQTIPLHSEPTNTYLPRFHSRPIAE